MKLQENIDRIKSMMGLITENMDKLTVRLVDSIGKNFTNSSNETLNNSSEYRVMNFNQSKNFIEVFDSHFYQEFFDISLPHNTYEKIRRDLIKGIIEKSELTPNEDTIICVRECDGCIGCIDTFTYGGGELPEYDEKIEITFDEVDNDKYDVEYIYHTRFGFIEITGTLIPYKTGRGVDYEFESDLHDQYTEEYYDDNWETIEKRIMDEFYRTMK